jgi:hypothetical protein
MEREGNEEDVFLLYNVPGVREVLREELRSDSGAGLGSACPRLQPVLVFQGDPERVIVRLERAVGGG